MTLAMKREREREKKKKRRVCKSGVSVHVLLRGLSKRPGTVKEFKFLAVADAGGGVVGGRVPVDTGGAPSGLG